jgi:hypothetical protein
MVTGFDLLALVRGACPGSDARAGGGGDAPDELTRCPVAAGG